MNKESIYNKEYYEKNKVHINTQATRRMQCAKCLKVVQFRNIHAHILTPKCERDYQKRIAPVIDIKTIKGGNIYGTFNNPDSDA